MKMRIVLHLLHLIPVHEKINGENGRFHAWFTALCDRCSLNLLYLLILPTC